MFLLLILVIGFYLYQSGDLQKLTQKFQSNETSSVNEAKRIIDIRYASGQISADEYTKIKNRL
ncbi:hypothetical protein [Neobacillus sp. SAB-20_R2A]|uniref:hypothetical protein n=1 Tax=Neobacillus sp. SAB-20_R2A TaxID=3120519 RepID=UPI003C6DFEDB